MNLIFFKNKTNFVRKMSFSIYYYLFFYVASIDQRQIIRIYTFDIIRVTRTYYFLLYHGMI